MASETEEAKRRDCTEDTSRVLIRHSDHSRFCLESLVGAATGHTSHSNSARSPMMHLPLIYLEFMHTCCQCLVNVTVLPTMLQGPEASNRPSCCWISL